MAHTPKKRRGRAARPLEEGERVGIGFRVTPALKTKIEAAATKSGRSQSQEIEIRLERSFGHEGLRLACGEREVRVIIYAGKVLLTDLPTASSPMEPAELDTDPETLQDIIDFFEVTPAKKP